MGIYATTTSLQTLMVGTTFDTATTALCTLLITDSENEINKYLSKRYDLGAFNTSTSIPPLVTSLCQKLTEGYMYHRLSRGGKEWRDRGKELVDDAISNLEKISSYKLDLVNTAGSALIDFSNTAYRCLSNTDTYTPTFNDDDELNWKVDQDKLDDISEERD